MFPSKRSLSSTDRIDAASDQDERRPANDLSADDLAERRAKERYPLGTEVTFLDRNTTTIKRREEPVTMMGNVNGNPVVFEGRTFVPVWARGEKEGSVYVAECNIIDVKIDPT